MNTGATTTEGTATLLSARNLVKHFPIRSGGLLRRNVGQVHAVCDVSFDLAEGETLGLVGESGCGKSTTARLAMNLIPLTSGQVRFGDQELTTLGAKEMRGLRRQMQLVFQDPYASLDPRMPVNELIAEPLRIHGLYDAGGRRQVRDLMKTVGLKPEHGNRYPHEFSGGQRQRIGIARAIALRPKLIVCDEAVSALDVSVQAQIINLLQDLQRELGLTYVFIAHDLSVVKHISDRVAVMYLGRVAEIATRDELYAEPAHPYTASLLSAIPLPDPDREQQRRQIVLSGDVPSPADPPSGCTFHTRCPRARTTCAEQVPTLDTFVRGGHRASCLFPVEPGQSVEARPAAAHP